MIKKIEHDRSAEEIFAALEHAAPLDPEIAAVHEEALKDYDESRVRQETAWTISDTLRPRLADALNRCADLEREQRLAMQETMKNIRGSKKPLTPEEEATLQRIGEDMDEHQARVEAEAEQEMAKVEGEAAKVIEGLRSGNEQQDINIIRKSLQRPSTLPLGQEQWN